MPRENRLRSIPITGVMPEPAVTSSSFVGQRLGQHELALGLLELQHLAGRARCTRWWETTPSGIALTVRLMQPSGRGPWVSE